MLAKLACGVWETLLSNCDSVAENCVNLFCEGQMLPLLSLVINVHYKDTFKTSSAVCLFNLLRPNFTPLWCSVHVC